MHIFSAVLFFASLMFMVATKTFIDTKNWPDAILSGIISVLIMVIAAVVFIGSYVIYASRDICG